MPSTRSVSSAESTAHDHEDRTMHTPQYTDAGETPAQRTNTIRHAASPNLDGRTPGGEAPAPTLTRQTSIHLERALSRGVDPAKVTPRRKPWQMAVTPFETILNEDYEGKGTQDEPYLVDWIKDDPENPQHMSVVGKWALTVFVSIATLAVALSSSCYSGAIRPIESDFPGYQTVVYILGVSLFVLGFALGPRESLSEGCLAQVQ